MGSSKLIIFILAITLLSFGCSKDDVAPSITYDGPDTCMNLYIGQTLDFNILSSDNEELQTVIVKFSYNDDAPIKTTQVDLIGLESSNSFNFNLDSPVDAELHVDIEIRDADENITTERITYNYRAVELGQLNLNFKLKYNNEALVMFQDYEYPDGRIIDFTRFSFYISNVSLDDDVINKVEFHNLTGNNAVEQTAIDGYDWMIDNIPVGDYSSLSFDIGVPEPQNSMDPGEFPSGHPLAKPSENWFSWNSYIFLKLEGNIDMDNDGTKDTAIALHLGASEAIRSISLDREISILQNEITNGEISIDIYDFFGGDTDTYQIDDNPQIHNLSQLDVVNTLANYLTQTIN